MNNGRGKRRPGIQKKQRRNVAKEVSPASIVYSGPVRTLAARDETDCTTVTLSDNQFISSSGTGVLAQTFSNDPSGYPEWTGWAGAYHEYRILAFQIVFHPNNRYSKTTTICRPVMSIIDRNNSGILANYDAALGHSSCKIRSVEDFWQETVRMVGIEDAGFKDTASPAADNWIKVYGDGLSVSTEYGMILRYCRVQFRGRR